MSFVVLTHGGAASAEAHADGCERAAERAAALLRAGEDAVAAAIEATRLLEDDARFNAGTGANLRFDGRLVQLDAALMASDGRIGAVACVEAVQNPILVAAAVMATPHIMLAGEGATAFARRAGFAAYDPVTDAARAKHTRALAELAGRGDGTFAEDAEPWRRVELARLWNFAGEPPRVASAAPVTPAAPRQGCDTVGAVVRDERGVFCATASTGGTVYMLRGRVGDSPLVGSGFYAGPHGGVAATGVGEEIARVVLAKTVYDWLAAGEPAEVAAERAVAMFPERIDVGVLVAGRGGAAIAANRPMARARVDGSC